MGVSRYFKRLSTKEKSIKNYVRSVFGVTPRSLMFYEVALTHSSVLPLRNEFVESNERLEFLGDAILDSVVAYYLYQNNPSLSEGELTKLKSRLVSRKNLNTIAFEIRMEDYLSYSINSNTRNTSILGNALEAMIGAIYLDLGYKKAEIATLTLLKVIDTDKVLYEQKDYKSLLHEWGQRMKKEVIFQTIDEQKVEGRSEYDVQVVIGGKPAGEGKASSKKKAQQIAAKKAYLKLNL